MEPEAILNFGRLTNVYLSAKDLDLSAKEKVNLEQDKRKKGVH